MPKRENKKAKTNEEILAQLNNAQRANAALKAKVVELDAKIAELVARGVAKEVAAQA